MNTQNHNGYMLLYRSDEWYNKLSHAELRKLMNRNKAWIESLTAQGKAKPGHALERRAQLFPAVTENSLRTDHSRNRKKPSPAI